MSNTDLKKNDMTLGLLSAVEADSGITQRTLASELGVALGLTNSYFKKCIDKGLVKIQQVPANRYAYYLTPRGFSEKSRLTAEYLNSSFSFYRRAKNDLSKIMATCIKKNKLNIANNGKVIKKYNPKMLLDANLKETSEMIITIKPVKNIKYL